MAGTSRTIAEKRLSITREAELLHSFVRINVDDFEKSLQDEKHGTSHKDTSKKDVLEKFAK
ncbi:hypothetical protein NQ317_006559 [Molorchus minor]|uniref:Uncharacterized protein n=1 Tax=Molorchus minor TaxID=1323400 RepID=A0ABQ9K0C9_9CUCU|nr:hypothetical protein NQ317_006559 [Molorchus minor]